MRAEDVLPDSTNHVTIDGRLLRKGTVAAFLANARVWLDDGAAAAQHTQAEIDMAEALPALRALGLFELMEVRDAKLRAWLLGR
ncbi:hypothetical protein [Trinickia diaoshuihuensis]|jgi:hypothetical protein|uniref:hypothetical protein n=1 Tax=Trinickia diaoshuihuensis TaxID=2292265 RepID=UPI000E26FA09|nr:hypothetical protein [Trinickia diaoshuihuensis]